MSTCPDLLKLSDETDLDVLNSMMEIMVEQFHNELLPVASQLTLRLVSVPFWRVFEYISNFERLVSNVLSLVARSARRSFRYDRDRS